MLSLDRGVDPCPPREHPEDSAVHSGLRPLGLRGRAARMASATHPTGQETSMSRTVRTIILLTIAALALFVVPTAQGDTGAQAAHRKPTIGGYKHLVVIFEENHSFDNLYGRWGRVGQQKVKGLKQAKAGTTQVDQAGQPIGCLLQNDANLITTS